MSEENHDGSVELQLAYDMIHRDATAHIASMKAQQWTVTHYAVLILASLFYLSGTGAVQFCIGQFAISLLSLSVPIAWCLVTRTTKYSIQEKRARLERIHSRFNRDGKSAYGEKSRRGDNTVYCCQLSVILIAVSIIIFNSLTRNTFINLG